jgi:ubiquinone/menaquinone biosynthesis C-methylase UbiE
VFDGFRRPGHFLYEVLSAATMPIGARDFSAAAISASAVGPADVVADIGCGPGTAARRAARKHARVIGIDPTPMMLAFARRLTRGEIADRIEWREGIAESIPLEDGEATVAIAIRSAHHFDDPSGAFAEIRRVLSPGGRLAIVERALTDRRRRRGSHGLSMSAAAATAKELENAGFVQATVENKPVRFGEAVIIRAVRP